MVKNSLILLMMLAVAVLLFPLQHAVAQERTPPGGNETPAVGTETPPVVAPPPADVCPGTGVSSRVVKCVRSAVLQTTTGFINAFYDYLRYAIYAAITLCMTLFGVKLVAGLIEQPPRDTFILLLKIGSVLYFTADFPDIYAQLIGVSQGLMDIVSENIHVSNALACGRTVADVWERLDCSLDRLMGLAPGKLLITGIVSMLTGVILSGPWGIVVFLLGLIIIFTLVFSITNSVWIYLNAFTALAILAMISPLIIPLVLFANTKQMFDKWVKMIIGYTLQPVFLVAYLALMITAFDTVLFRGQNSVYFSIAGAEALEPNFSVGDYFERHKLYTSNPFKIMDLETALDGEDPELKTENTTIFGRTFGYATDKITEKTGDIVGAVTSKTTKIFFGFEIRFIDAKLWAEHRGISPQKLIRDLLVAFISAGMMAYVLYSTLKFVPALGTEMASGAMDGFNLAAVGGGMPGSRAFRRGVAAIRGG